MLGRLEANQNGILFGAVVGSFLLAVVWEALWPRRPVGRDAVARWAPNIGLSLINQTLVYWVGALASVAAAWVAARTGPGWAERSGLGFGAVLVLVTLVYELLAYALHRLLHRVPVLWRIHAVHHSDTELDFSTTYRSHPLELFLVAAATFPVTLLIGPPVAVVVAYQFARVCVNVLAHSNVYVPEPVDRLLRRVIVTPDFHRCHHSNDRRFTDSNYGAFLSVFDHLFGTATSKPFGEHPGMRIGLEYLRAPRDSRLGRLLLLPFVFGDAARPQPRD